MSYDGLRDWLVQVNAMGELRTVEGIDWNLDACRLYEWMKDFPEVAETSPELRSTVLEKFGRSFFGVR